MPKLSTFDVIMNSYPQLLSDGAYKLLVRLLYASRITKSIEATDLVSMNRRIHIDSIYSESHWLELIDRRFLTVRRLDDRTVYKLDHNRVNNDCGKEDFGPLRIFLQSTDANVKNQEGDLDDDSIRAMIIKYLGADTSKPLIDNVMDTVRKLIAYSIENDKDFTSIELRKMLNSLSAHDHHVIDETCHIYNDDPEKHLTKGWGYIKGMAKNIASRPINKRTTFRKAMDLNFKVRDNPERNERSDKFALKLVMGNMESNKVYKNLLEKNRPRLIELYNRGIELMRESGLETRDAYRNYEWLTERQ